ncbi:MAG: carboxypeptidase-like regulatory domain-containing protein, partial [Rhodothermales bacterium]
RSPRSPTVTHRAAAALVLVLLMVGYLTSTAAAQTGTVVGQIVDAQTKGTLPGATVRVGQTLQGAAADLQGRFRLARIPAGPATLIISYVGYNTKEVTVDVPAGGRLDVNIALELEVVRGQEVVVTAQLVGQAQAINSQLSSNTIVNVVAPERIQELPDQNAAEAVGRLPGIAIQRNAGEGTKVVIRGLSPKFSAITVNGERVPSTDSEDRSVDLSMISSDVLAGIEVFKALTPDKDADAIGGSVNFVIRKAPDGKKGSILAQTGYSDHEKKYGQFKGAASMSDRFFNKRLGVLLTGSAQQADRSSDVIDAEYEFIRGPREGEDHALLNVAKLNLVDRLETRDRYSASATMDYQLTNGGLMLNTFWGRTNRDEVRRRKRYRVGDGRTEYELRDQNIDITLLTNSLSGWHHLGPLDVEWRTSLSKTNRNVPFSHTARFQELAAFKNDLIDDQGPELIPEGAKLNLDNTWFQFANQATEKVDDQNTTGQLDLSYQFGVGGSIRGLLKVGGKYRDKNRDRNRNELQTPFGVVDQIGDENPGLYTLDDEGHIKFENFVDPSFDAGEFLGGVYDFGPGLDSGLLRNFWDTYKSRYGVNRFALLDNYDAGETVSAAYLMTQFDVKNRFMLLPGFRVEHTS